MAVFKKLFMALKDHKIVAIAFMVAEKEVLAMCGVYVFPIIKGDFYCRKRWMDVHYITDVVLFQKLRNLVDSIVLHIM